MITAGDVPVPSVVVLDVGWCADPMASTPGWRVVEANAAWLADWYDPDDMEAVIETITVSQRGVSDRWRWHPSPLLMNCSAGLARR